MSTATSLDPTADRIQDLARAAREFVLRATGCAIDLREESLAFVDHYLGLVRDGHLSDEVLALVSSAIGVHLGEVAIAKFGGAWRGPLPPEGRDPDDPANWRVELGSAPLSFDPIGMAAEALRLGAVEGYDADLRTRPDLHGALMEALARAAPVSDEYYYSLTGRFETIEYAVELLCEIQRQRREQQLPS